MEYVYAALLLDAAEKEVNEENLKKVLKASGIKADDARIKALLAGLEDVDIKEVISKSAAVPTVQPAATPSGEEEKGEEEKGKEDKKEEEEKEEEVSEEEAAEGLGALFG